MRILGKREKSLKSSATLHAVALVLFLTLFTTLSLGIADDLSGHNATSGGANSFIAPRYAVIDLGTNLYPLALSQTGNVLLSSSPGGPSINFGPLTPQLNCYRWHGGVADQLQVPQPGPSTLVTVWGMADDGAVILNVNSYRGAEIGYFAGATSNTPAATSPSPINPGSPGPGGEITGCLDYNGMAYGMYITTNNGDSGEAIWGNYAGSPVFVHGNVPNVAKDGHTGNIGNGATTGMVDGAQVNFNVCDINSAGDAVGNSSSISSHNVLYLNHQIVATPNIPATDVFLTLNNTTRVFHHQDGTQTLVKCPQILGRNDQSIMWYQQNPDTGLYDRFSLASLIAPDSGWSSFTLNVDPFFYALCPINDAGAIVGTATLTTVSGTTTTTSSHGVLLLPATVTSVSFDGTKYWQLESDDTTTNYSAPQWTDTNGNYNASDSGEHNYGVAYTCNTKPKFGATFKIPGASSWTNLKFKATGSDGISIPATAPSSVSGDVVTMPVTESTTTLPSTIKYYNKADTTAFTLNWSISVDGGTTWSAINSTKHTVYVTLADPVTSLRQESLFEIGCREANGLSGSATDSGVKGTVTDAIFGDFISRNVKRVDGTQLTYYHSYTTTVTTTEDLLAGGDGQCGSWTSLFLDIRKAQGISDTNNYVLFNPINPTTVSVSFKGFIVNNWTFTATGNSGNSSYPYLNLPNLTSFIGTSSYNWLYAEVNRAPGIPGQGTASPASFFNNHQMAYVNGQYYDPSYGIKHPTVADVQTSLAGFYVGPTAWSVDEPTVNLDLNGNGNKTDTGVSTTVFILSKNSTTLNLTPTVSTY